MRVPEIRQIAPILMDRTEIVKMRFNLESGRATLAFARFRLASHAECAAKTSRFQNDGIVCARHLPSPTLDSVDPSRVEVHFALPSFMICQSKRLRFPDRT